MNSNQFYERISNDIDRCGVSVMGIFGGNSSEAAFYYSIGAKAFDLPELYTSCLSQQMGMFIVNNVFYNMLNKNITEACLINGLLGNDLSLALIDVTNNPKIKTDKTIQAGQYYQSEDYKVYQIVLPDTNNKFPWDDGFVDFSNGSQELFFDVNDKSLINLSTVEVEQTSQDDLTSLLNSIRNSN